MPFGATLRGGLASDFPTVLDGEAAMLDGE